MFVRITRTWCSSALPLAKLDAGQTFDVSATVAMYLFALRCAEPVAAPEDCDTAAPTAGRDQRHPSRAL